MVKTLLASFLLFTGLAFSQAFPGAVVTNATIPFAVDHSTTNLSTNITSSSTTITVASSTSFAAYEVVNIDSEQIQICSVSVNILNVCVGGRGYFGTTVAAHSLGANVFGYVNAGYHNAQFTETAAIENWLLNTQPGIINTNFVTNNQTLPSFLQAGTGAVLRTNQSKLRDIISIKDFGAVCNGITNDTPAIQLAINSLTTGQALFINPSVAGCRITAPGLVVNNLNNITIYGTDGSELLSTDVVPTWQFLTVEGSTSNLTVSGIVFQGSATTSPVSVYDMQVGVNIQDPPTGGGPGPGSTGTGIIVNDSTFISLNSGIMNRNETMNNADIFQNTFLNSVDPSGTSGFADILTLGKHWHIHNNSFLNSAFQGVYLSGANRATGGASYGIIENNTSTNSGHASFVVHSEVPFVASVGNVIANNVIVTPQQIAVVCSGNAVGCIITGNSIYGASGSVGSFGLIYIASAVAIGVQESSIVSNNVIYGSTGTETLILSQNASHLAITNNVMRNNPSASPAIQITTVDATPFTGVIVSGNTVSGGGVISIQGAGVGNSLLSNSIISGNNIDGTIFNVDTTVSQHNIIAGNVGASFPNFQVITPVSIGAASAAKSTLDVFGNMSIGAFAGVSAAPANGIIVSGPSAFGRPVTGTLDNLTVANPANGVGAQLGIGDAANNGSSAILFRTSTGLYNWQVFGQKYNTNTWGIAPSTAVSGETFTTPAFYITAPSGQPTIPFLHSTTGQRFVCVDTTGDLVSSATACVGT